MSRSRGLGRLGLLVVEKVEVITVSTKLLRGAGLSLGAVLAVAFLPGGVAAADEDDLYWAPNYLALTTTSEATDALGITQITGYGPLSGLTSAFDSTDVDPNALQANETITDFPGNFTTETFDITAGDGAIPAGSTIDVTFLTNTFADETVEIPHSGLFGLPEIIDTFFTPFGAFSF